MEAGRPAVEVLLQPASTRELAVRGPAPLRDLRVRVYPARWQGSPPPPLASYETGDGGRLSRYAWPDGAEALLLAEAADLAPAVVRVAEDGTLVAGALVSGGLVPVRTDGSGLAAVRGLPAGEGTVLKVTASGFLPAEQPIPRSEAEEVTVTLRPGVVVRGRVVDAGGEPLVGARASVRVGCDAVRFAPVAVTEGRFEATIEPGTPASVLLESPSTRQMEIKLEPGQSGEARDLGDRPFPGSGSCRTCGRG